MRAHYGYQDGSGTYTISVDTSLCTSCEDCVRACPAGVLTMVEEDPVEERMVAGVDDSLRNQVRVACAPCKPGERSEARALPCTEACAPHAIEHSW